MKQLNEFQQKLLPTAATAAPAAGTAVPASGGQKDDYSDLIK
jgi:hypothetical protein